MTTETIQEVRAGAYSPYTCAITTEAKKSFLEASRGIVGVKCSPVAVSQQIVGGINYKFFCNTQTNTAHPEFGSALVSIYQPLEGPAHITHIKTL